MLQGSHAAKLSDLTAVMSNPQFSESRLGTRCYPPTTAAIHLLLRHLQAGVLWVGIRTGPPGMPLLLLLLPPVAHLMR